MTSIIDTNLTKNIKKNIYGKAQIAKIIFPAGFGTIAFEEAKDILHNLWYAQKFTGQVYLLKNEIQVRPVYMHAIAELLLRNHCFTDVRLVIAKDTVIGKKAFTKKISSIKWDYYLNKNMLLKIKVNSVASKAFHESGLKEILTEEIKPYVSEVVSGENSNETTCLYAELYKDKLTISISLAGQPLYKRGYRGKLTASAPLREDAAACCIQKVFLFVKKYNLDFLPRTVLIPFSGTGTFAFEYYQTYFQFIPALLAREYSLQKMPLFKEANFNFLLNKAKEYYLHSAANLNSKDVQIVCMDNSSNANTALSENAIRFKKAANDLSSTLPTIISLQDDFFASNFSAISGNVFMPLNPPYGLRLGNEPNSIAFYKRIARKINEIALITQRNQSNLLGFILCQTEDTWSVFIKNLAQAQTETYHFTQGGLHIRVCQFYI